MRLKNAAAVLLIGSSLTCAWSSPNVDVVPVPLITGNLLHSPSPIELRLRNNGPEGSFVIQVGNKEEHLLYPVHLLRGEQRSITTYCALEVKQGPPSGPEEASTEIVLRSAGTAADDLLPQTVTLEGSMSNTVLLISNSRGTLDYLRRAETATTRNGSPRDRKPVNNDLIIPTSVGYLAPKKAFLRAIGYRSIGRVVLGAGSAKLSEAQIEVIKHYAAHGGRLVFSPSPESAAHDPRWAALIPPAGGCKYFMRGITFRLSRPAEFSGDDPEKRHSFFRETAEWPTDRWFNSIAEELPPSTVPSKSGVDPFSIRLPSLIQLSGALAFYFLIVIPCNFLILRKLNRQDLMWLTAPALAIAFSMLILRSGRQLSDAPQGVAVSGVEMWSDDMRHGTYAGILNVFSPKASAYTLAIHGLQYLNQYERPFNPEQRYSSPPPLPDISDTGSLSVPVVRSSALDFRALTFEQDLSGSSPVRFGSDAGADGLTKISVKNVGSKAIKNATLVAGEFATNPQDLEPGASLKLPIDRVRRLDPAFLEALRNVPYNLGGPQGARTLDEQLLQTTMQVRGQVGFFGTLDNEKVGPVFPAPATYRSTSLLVCYAPLEMKLP